MKIQVFGTNCAPCALMKKNVELAVAASGLDCQVEHVTRILDMIEHGISATPALKIDGELLVMGKTLDVNTIQAMIAHAAQRTAA